VKENILKRNQEHKIALVDEWLGLDKEWRELKGQTDSLRSRRNKLSEEINAARKAGKHVHALLDEAKKIPETIKKNDERMAAAEQAMNALLLKFPNILHDSVPKGKDEKENVTITTFGTKPHFSFTPMSHVDLAEKQGWIDMERAAKISGARWYFLKDDLAKLELAIINYAVQLLTTKGFTLTIPPYMLGDKAYKGVCDIDTFQNEIYHDEKEKLSLIATSEHPLTSMYMDETLDAGQLPVKMAGFSACFRKEAGAHGKDQKGIFRVHQFHKIEQVVFALPSESWQIHEQMKQNMQQFFESLGLHGRIIILCSGDTGHISAKTYDCECWFPVQDNFRETGSCSNCTSYQAQGLNTRYQKAEERHYLHTLNSTMVATTRCIVAILENFQNPDGTVRIPAALQPYMGKKVIGKSIR